MLGFQKALWEMPLSFQIQVFNIIIISILYPEFIHFYLIQSTWFHWVNKTDISEVGVFFILNNFSLCMSPFTNYTWEVGFNI